MDVDRNYTTVNGKRWAYLEIGKKDAEPLLMLHGMNGSADIFLPMISYLSNDFRLIIPDLPGFGFTEQLEDNSYLNIAKGLIDFCHALGIKNIKLFGFSAGGALALTMTYLRKTLVDRLIVQSPFWRATGVKPGWVEKMQISLGKMPEPVVAIITNPYVLSKILILLSLLNPGMRSILRQYKDIIVKAIVMQRISAAHAFWISLQKIDMTKYFEKIQIKSLVIAAEKDNLIPPSDSKQLYSNLNKSDITQIPECGHGAIFEKPNEVANVIKVFLRSGDVLNFLK